LPLHPSLMDRSRSFSTTPSNLFFVFLNVQFECFSPKKTMSIY
jgi:hypothetical protein